jgi:hypothetical protein
MTKQAISPLRQRMIEDMAIRPLSALRASNLRGLH